MSISNVLTVTEAAARLGIDRRNVAYHLKRGSLAGKKIGPIWVIPAAQVERLIARRHGAKPGPKPKPGKPSLVTPASTV